MKVFVGLSGGVDSAVAAYLLIQQGHQIECGFMRNWDASINNDFLGNPTLDQEVCPQETDYMDALKVAKQLNVKLHRVDFVQEYWDEVFNVFIQETKKGYTPNPDILCNKHIKFDAFIDYAKKHGFDAIATGHYAQKVIVDGIPYLAKAADKNKDQTYFLVQMPRDVLDYVIFPLGSMQKDEVRAIAKEQGFELATKKDSTGICFIGERHFRDFLHNYIPSQPGNIIDVDTKKILGKHHGVMFYTIGQRKGLHIDHHHGPWFVVGKDLSKNELYVGLTQHHPDLYSDACILDRVNLLTDKIPTKCTAKFRYRQKDNEVVCHHQEGKLYLSYPQTIAAVTLGQEAVLYDGDICLGGGQISQVLKKGQPLSEMIYGKVHHDQT